MGCNVTGMAKLTASYRIIGCHGPAKKPLGCPIYEPTSLGWSYVCYYCRCVSNSVLACEQEGAQGARTPAPVVLDDTASLIFRGLEGFIVVLVSCLACCVGVCLA